MTEKKNEKIVVNGEELNDNILNQMVAYRMSRLASILTRKDIAVEVQDRDKVRMRNKKLTLPKEELQNMSLPEKLKMGTCMTLDKVSHTLFDYS